MLKECHLETSISSSYYFFVLFCFFETGFICVALAVLDQQTLNSLKSVSLCFPSAVIKGVRHHYLIETRHYILLNSHLNLRANPSILVHTYNPVLGRQRQEDCHKFEARLMRQTSTTCL